MPVLSCFGKIMFQKFPAHVLRLANEEQGVKRLGDVEQGQRERQVLGSILLGEDVRVRGDHDSLARKAVSYRRDENRERFA